jgi:iron complex outermembrane receptor protein
MIGQTLKMSLMLGAAAMGCALTSPAVAQDGTEQAVTSGDIIVTAQRRSELARDVPISITALNADMLKKAGVNNLQDLERVTPGLALPLYGGFLRPSIRGISSGVTSVGDSSNIAVYVDGVYQPTQTAAIVDMPDTQLVQVLKGPQGTLYGQNATGGAIIIDTLKPSFSLKGELVASYGNYKDIATHGYITGPLSDKVAVLLSGSFEDRDGYNRDLLRGGHDDGLRSHQVRGKILFTPSDTTEFTLAGYYSKRDDSGVYTGAPLNGNSTGNALTRLFFPGTPVASEPHTFATSFRPDLLSETYGTSLLGKIDIGDFGTLSSVTAFQHAKVTDLVDVDAAPINLAEVRPLVILGQAFIQELNFASKKMGRFSFSAGAFYMNRKEQFQPNQFGGYELATAPAANFDRTGTYQFQLVDYYKTVKNSYAAYLELNYDITDQLTITAAGRYSYETVLAFHSGGFGFPLTPPSPQADPRGTFTFKKFTPRAVLRYKPDANNTFYASYSQGFKSGFVDGGNIGSCPKGPSDSSCILPPVKPETVDAFEIGYKGRISNQLSFNLSAFHYKYKDIQVFIYRPPTGIYQNAAEGTLNGVDFDFDWQPTHDLRLSLGGSYVDSKYSSFPAAQVYVQTPAAGCSAQFLPFPCGNFSSSINASGNQLQNAPRFTGTASIDYGFDTSAGRFGVNVNGNYNSGFPFDAGGHIRQKEYMLVNAELSYSPKGMEGLRVVAWGKNLSNHDYLQGSLPTFYADLVSWAPPRTYGVRLEYRFGQ